MFPAHWMTAPDAQVFAEDYLFRAEALREQQRFVEAVPDYNIALCYWTNLPSVERVTHAWLLARAWVGRGQCLQMQAPERALEDYANAIDLMRSAPEAPGYGERILLPVALRGRAGLLADEERYEEGLRDAGESLELWRRLSEEGHAVGEDLADTLLKRAGIYMAADRMDESWTDCDEAVRVLDGLRGDGYEIELNLDGTALLCRAMSAERRGMDMDAMADLDAAAARLEVGWPDAPELSLSLFAGVLFERARLARKLGDDKQALDDCERSLQASQLAHRRQGQADYALWAEMYLERADLLAGGGVHGRALDDLEQALHYFEWVRKYGTGYDEARVEEAREKRREYVARMRDGRTFDA